MTIYMEQLPIFGITKDTIVAIRYTVREGQVMLSPRAHLWSPLAYVFKARRLQMRMHSSAECRQLVHAFESRGMEFMEQRPGTARPGTARPLTAQPLTTSSQLATPQPSSPHFKTAQQSARHLFAPQVLEAGSLSQARPTSPERPNAQAQLPLQQHDKPDLQSMAPPKFFTSDKILAPRDVAPSRPSTAHIFCSHSMQPQSSQAVAYDEHLLHATSFAAPLSTNNTTAASDLDQGANPHQSNSHSTAYEDSSNSLRLGSDAEESFQAGINALNTDLSHDGFPATAWPATGSSLVFAETLEHEIPPRRELPFPRPDSRRSAGSSTSSRPRSALALPPLPKPRTSPQKPASSLTEMRPPSMPISPARPHTSSPQKRSFADMDSALSCDRPSTASPLKTASATKCSSPQAPAKKLVRMDQLLDGRKASLQQKVPTSKVPRMDSLADAPGEEDELFMRKDPSPSKVPTQRGSMSPLRRTNTDQDSTVNAYAAINSAVQRSSSLQQYAAQSLEDRQAALDEFMVQNLENPDFVTLCKDVENCWKRIALGL